MNKLSPRSLALLVGVSTLLLTACNRQLIPNTDIEDTNDNRVVIEFCESYRRAVEQKDIARLLSLAHPDYYEDGGSVDASDDLDKVGLQGYLEQRFVQASSIRYEMHYRAIERNESDGWNVAYSYSASFRLPHDTEELWHREVAENQLELVPVGDSYMIVSGM